MASSEERKRAVAENESLKDRILHLEAENDRLRNEQRVAEAADVVEPVIKVAAVEDLSLKAPSPTAAVPTTSVVNPINQVARSAAFASTSGGASGIAIDSVMQKLREWTIKLDELDDSQY